MPTELAGYLFNLSLIAVTFATVSALVMLLRQTMGGHLSNFDLYLISSYVGLGFVLAFDAILPPAFGILGLPEQWGWTLASGLAAALLAGVMVSLMSRRRRATPKGMGPGVMLAVLAHWVAVLLLAINAAAWTIQGPKLFVIALTVSLGALMWSFVRRITSLLGDKPGEDWDPRRG